MGILDEAIREHLELKRQHGAEEKEIEGLEAEAFGPADRPDATEPETTVLPPEAQTSQEALSSEPAGQPPPPGGPAPEAAASAPEAPAEPASESGTGEIPASPGATEPEAMPPADPVGATVPDVTDEGQAPVADPVIEDESGDAGDLLEAERQRLSSHPTEHYDVDAAIAEEDELDVLSESSLSDELDRALDGPAVPVSEEEAEPQSDFESVTGDPPAEGAAEEIEDAEYEAVMEASPEEEPEDDDLEEQEEEPAGDFFDQDDPLEGTPDFLEETPEHDRLWFEQKQPKDFDFGD